MNNQRLGHFIIALGAGLALIYPARALERLEPPEGCYLGFSVGGGESLARFNARLGIRPAVYTEFFQFPLTTGARSNLTEFLNQVRPTRGIALITLEPYVGLSNVTSEACSELARLCSSQEAQGIGGILVRFAHEMNGNWNPWGQQPVLYKSKFRLLAQQVHANTTRTAMLWAPSYGGGYPFGNPRVAPGTPDFAALDTDADGELSQSDDMYEPYYPGDDVVDWVGLTLYHWGVRWPWIENELPEGNSFAQFLTGNYNGGNGDQMSVPDFYARYCADGVRNKPLAIPETAAFFNPHQGGAHELAIKQAWWRQMFNVTGDTPDALDVALHFPKLKCVSWFDHYKVEPEQNQWIDWRVSAYAPVRSAFVDHVRALRNGRPWFLTAQEFAGLQRPDCISDLSLPTLLPVRGTVSLSLLAKAQTNCDLVVNLLDQNLQWQAGTRAPVGAGTQTVELPLRLTQPLVDGATYRWNIFLTATGGGQSQAFASYDGLQPVARAVIPSIQLVAFPPVLASPSNFTVTVQYTAADSAVAVVNLLNNGRNWHGGGVIPVSRGDGQLDVPVTVQAGLTNGNYQLECFLSDSSTNWQETMARAPNVAIRVASSANPDFLNVVSVTPMLPAGEVFRFAVSYTATTNRDLHIDLFDGNTNFLAGASQAVAPGSGVEEMTISCPRALPGKYFVTGFITPSGESWTQALAWSPDRRITVVGADYMSWLESNWGVPLGSDLVQPEQDADADGASNQAEFIAQTDPRNNTLRIEASATAHGLLLSWRSVVGYGYQLQTCARLQNNSWTSLGPALIGTAGRLEFPITLSAVTPPAFYRVKVLETSPW